jgi:hypothetical protein
MDDADRAEWLEQQQREMALRNHANRPIEAVIAVPYCLNCGEKLPAWHPPLLPQRWCDADCCYDWARRHR